MPNDPDLSALLPPPPPPRLHRPEAAIDAAMRRFDGEPDTSRQTTPPGRWRLLGKTQFGALAAAALVAAIGLPLWLSGESRSPTPTHTSAALDTVAPAQTVASADLAAQPPAEPSAQQPPGIVASPAAPADAPAPPAQRAARTAALADVAPAPAPLPAEFAAAPAPPPPPPPPAAVAAAEAENVGEDIVVTGSRISRPEEKARARIAQRAASRGDWNACTVADPRRNPAACRKTAPLVGEGLVRAWRDDDAGAAAYFDRAIAGSPKLADAWLNRGLVRARDGDDAGALADLDKAVRYAPNSARVLFQRSVILRRLGKTDRADADAARAADLDRRYEDLVE